MAKKDETNMSPWIVFGFLFIGSAAIGSGIGQLTDNAGAWSPIGAGVGFILGALYFILQGRQK